MSTAVATPMITPEELLAMPDSKSYELVGGQLLERHIGAFSSQVGFRLSTRLDRYVEEKQLGIVWPADNGYQCFPQDPGQVRRPDVSFIRNGRLAGDVIPQGWIKIPPDLAVEVVSPNDLAGELEEKLQDYRIARVPLIWVIYPGSRTATVSRTDGLTSHLEETDELSGEDVIPGFRCPLSELFPPRKQLGATTAASA